MNEKQLKLAKLYAELIDVEVLEYKGALLYPNDQGYMCENGVTCDWFNPFIGKLQLDARDNFKVDIYHSLSCVHIDDLSGLPFVSWSDSSIEVAVIECILKSKGLIQ